MKKIERIVLTLLFMLVTNPYSAFAGGNGNSKQTSKFDWSDVMDAIIQVESNGNRHAKNGNQVWKWTWDGTKQNNTSATQPAMIIFSNSGAPQTADLEFKNGGYYTKSGLFDVVSPTGIRPITTDTQGTTKIYTLDGRQVRTANKGVYIINGKKRVLK